ncbi:MAG TPA: DNA-directed RNA polymerase subunit beta [Armatimonadota bacterium]|nr:DNA-directed RNA polymerase subunit beta [Armatimonadota bacterium]
MKAFQHSYSRTPTALAEFPVPNLVDIQLSSYGWFLREGLRELFHSFSPIYDFTGSISLELLDYTLGEPKYSIEDCRDRDMTYEAPIKAKVRLTEAGREVMESEVYLGDLPLMTEKGTFVINGAERVVVSQLARSPGVYFRDTLDFSGRVLYFATIIPNDGAWLDIETDANDVITVRIHQAKKFPLTTLLRALSMFQAACPEVEMVPTSEAEGRTVAAPLVDVATGEVLADAGRTVDASMMKKIGKATLSTEGVAAHRASTPADTTGDIVELFGERRVIQNPTRDELLGMRVVEDMVDPKTGKPILKAYGGIEKEVARKIENMGLAEIEVFSVNKYVESTLSQDPTHSKEEALLDIYRKIRPGDPATIESAKSLMTSIFFDARRYDLAKVGRHKLNKKLGLRLPLSVRTITKEDLISIIRYIIALSSGVGSTDDIDHLENKRVRSVGELLQSQLRMGFLRMEKVAKERMTSLESENIIPQVVLSVKPISASIRSFFGSSQLSQFMDQTNPLAELTHKRRLSALGPGGLSRQSAKLEVRDVHHSHYGRICPIETPEGPNIGLIGYLAIQAGVDEFGFIRTPYRRVINGRVTGEIHHLIADEEDHYHIAPANTPVGEDGHITEAHVTVRHGGTYPTVPANVVDYMDVSPMQVFSVAAALIPFLENDDANRALMGSNMQRQAVPLLRSCAPMVKTGVERRAAIDSGGVVTAKRDGIVKRVTAEQITVLRRDGGTDEYRLMNMVRSNQATCITQKPLAKLGQRVRVGDVIADGPCTSGGELALGQNVVVAFVPWNGYNYEDAIVISSRLAKDDIFTSIHIEKYEVEARDTKLGPEEVTRDIPNVGEDVLKDLDENGIIRIGAEVVPEDILVGKVAPKGQGELTAEERLIIAIFGKKAEETRDVSLRVPHGEKGKVIDTKVFSRFKYKCSRCETIFNFSRRPDRTICDRCDGELERLPGDELMAGVNQLVRVYIAQKRKVMEGDKLAGRHGNKGVISKIVPEEDMPFLPDGTPVDMVLNPLGVPSRMNIGQILETHLGLVAGNLGGAYINPIFQGAKEADILVELDKLAKKVRDDRLRDYVNTELKLDLSFEPGEDVDSMIGKIQSKLSELSAKELEDVSRIVNAPPVMDPEGYDAEVGRIQEAEESGEDVKLKPASKRYKLNQITDRIRGIVWSRAGIDENTGKCRLVDGMSGGFYNQPVTVGYMYMMKLAHLVDDKIHARSTGPYSLVTQQPLGGKAQFGGQRFGEMEVWALEAYGAAYTLQEILTVKSDDVLGRVKTYESIVKGDSMLEPGVPESFKILVNEMQSLSLKVTVEDDRDREIDLKDKEEESSESDSRQALIRRRRQLVESTGEIREDAI